MSQPYPHIFRPLRVGSLDLPNRIVMGSMHTGLEQGEGPLDRLAEFYRLRAAGGAGLIVTGGWAPNAAGNLGPPREQISTEADAERHRPITRAVRDEGGRIVLQILHAGRYAFHDAPVSASAIRSPINRVAPRALDPEEIEQTIEDFVTSAQLAKAAGYHGVEVMGSEGYLISQFLALRTNHREDDWGGPLENRMRLPVEIVRRIRAKAGDDFLIVFRHSALDLVEGGLTGDESIAVAKAIEAAGADMINTGIGWHEAQIPTIAQPVPAGAFTWATRRLTGALTIPVAASNRIHTPEDAEEVLARGDSALVSMARPFLADADIVAKAARGDRKGINLCISCNQACLDHYFLGKSISCLVNPAAAHETEYRMKPSRKPKTVLVAGGGMAGLSAALTAAQGGHHVTLFEASDALGGQFNLARHVPGKAVFAETIDYFATQLERLGVQINLNSPLTMDAVRRFSPDHVIVSTGVVPRIPDIEGVDHPSVVSYTDVLNGTATVGRRVAVIGAGGIGYDVCLFLVDQARRHHNDIAAFNGHWGIDTSLSRAGGLLEAPAEEVAPRHEITLLKRSEGPFGRTLGKTTGWVHRRELHRNGVKTLAGVEYRAIDSEGLHYFKDGEQHCLKVDTVVLCAGQVSRNDLARSLDAAGIACDVVGGARLAGELDAKRAIEEGMRAALAL